VVRIRPAGTSDDADVQTLTWREDVQYKLAGLRHTKAFAGLPLDYTPASLDPLARFVLQQIEPDDVDGGDPLIDGLVAYVGETLMRIGGGRWVWSGGRAVVRFDDGLGVPSVAPLSVLVTTAEQHSGRQLIKVYAEVAAAVAARQTVDPMWEPEKLATVGVDTVPAEEPAD
jgi:hypothetical protein